MTHCSMNSHREGLGHHAPVAPCCERKAPMPAASEPSAQIVAPVQIALMAAAYPVAQLALIQPSLPKGLRVVPVYDRSQLIDRAVKNLRHTLIEELIIVSLVIRFR